MVRSSPEQREGGFNFIEVSIGTFIALIALAMVAALLIGAQKQEKVAGETARTVDTARLALAGVVKDLRGAKSIYETGSGVDAWFDADSDSEQDPGEVQSLSFRTTAFGEEFVRTVSGVERVLASGLQNGTLMVSLLTNGQKLTISFTVPSLQEGRAGTTLRSEVTTRGNF